MQQPSFGTTLGSFGAGLVAGPRLCAWAEAIEGVGFDCLWFRDHVLWHSPVLDPFTALGALAARTSRIRLGTGVLLLPLRHPVLVAKAVATLDHVSAGRAILGVGLGGEFPMEYEVCGVPMRERGRRADEAMQVLKRLWTTTPASFAGRFYQLHGVCMEPRPVQQPHPPIWVGGRSEAALARAGKHADGWLAYFETPETFRRKLDTALSYRQPRPDTMTPFTGGLVLYFRLAPSYEQARQEAVRYLSREYRQPFDRLVDQYCALGPASECLATVQRFIEAGVSHIDLIPMCEPERVLDQLRECAAALFPVWKRQEAVAQIDTSS